MRQFAPLIATVLLVVAPAPAQTQSGSMGGTIGKTDKSASGDAELPQQQPRSKSLGRSVNSTSNASVSGKWHWSADCPSGHWVGQFDLFETSNGQFSGNFDAASVGTITNGHVYNGNASFTRHINPFATQIWVGHLTPGHMTGSLSGNESCQWQASK